MRREFFKVLHEQMSKNPDIWALTGDLGYGGFDKIREYFPDRFINCGASEQAMIGIACGLAAEGKIPFVYSITNFLLYRPFEFVRNYVNHEGFNVKLIASGRDKDYAHDGFSHHSEDAKQVIDLLPNIQQLWPETKEEIPYMVGKMIGDTRPYFISLKR